jgi:hypothetical protein
MCSIKCAFFGGNHFNIIMMHGTTIKKGNVLVYRHLYLLDCTWYILSRNKPRFLPNIFIANKP